MKHELSPRRSSVGRAAIGRHGGAIQVLMNKMYVRHLISVYHAFDGDFVAAIVLGEVAHHNLTSLVDKARTPRELSDALRADGPAIRQAFLPTNTFSIAQATGIPRETVRRKVATLTRRGWMVRDAEGNLFVSAGTEKAFAEFHVERLNDLLEAAQAIGALLHDRQDETGTRRPPQPNGSTRGGPADGSS
jgi:hypothetical protein